MSETFGRLKRGLEDDEISICETGLKMFDIVNREYEENGSFRCDFSQRKNVIAN